MDKWGSGGLVKEIPLPDVPSGLLIWVCRFGVPLWLGGNLRRLQWEQREMGGCHRWPWNAEVKSSLPDPWVLPRWPKECVHHPLLLESSQLAAALHSESKGRCSKCHAIDHAWPCKKRLPWAKMRTIMPNRKTFLGGQIWIVWVPCFLVSLVLKYLFFLVAIIMPHREKISVERAFLDAPYFTK